MQMILLILYTAHAELKKKNDPQSIDKTETHQSFRIGAVNMREDFF